MCGMFPFPVGQGVCEWAGCVCVCAHMCARVHACMHGCVLMIVDEGEPKKKQFRLGVHPVRLRLWTDD